MASRSTTPGLEEHPLNSPLTNDLRSPTTTTPLLQDNSPSSKNQPNSETLARPGSMVLYRLADDSAPPTRESSFAHEPGSRESVLLPPNPQFGRVSRSSTFSIGATSARSSIISSDSKYPFFSPTATLGGAHLRDSAFSSVPFNNMRERGLVAYSYDPAEDESEPPDEEDILHDPSSKLPPSLSSKSFPWRGIANISFLIFLVLALLCLFVFYPVYTFLKNEKKNLAIDGNVRINATGQAPVLYTLLPSRFCHNLVSQIWNPECNRPCYPI